MRILSFALAVVLAVATPSLAAPVPRAYNEAAQLAALGFAPGDVGYILFDPVSRRTLQARNADAPFIPASVAKIPTTLMALDILGPEHRFETVLLARGRIAGGELRGDLFLRGGGDPLLFTENLAGFVAQLRALGITRVSGGFYYDSGFLKSYDRTDIGQPVAASYNTGIGALSVNFNRVQLTWGPARGRMPAFRDLRAISGMAKLPVSWITVGRTPTDTPPGVDFLRFVEGDREHWQMAPHLPSKGHAWLPVRDAGRHAAMLFRELAAASGIVLPPPQSGTTPADAQPIHQHAGQPLTAVAEQVLQYSNNLAAELVGLTTTRRLAGAPLDLPESAAIMVDWLRRTMPAANWAGFALHNHSGLSSASRMSPRQMAAILGHALLRVYGDTDYAGLMPRMRLDKAPRKGKKAVTLTGEVRAKSGSMSYARARAGQMVTAANRRLGFVLFIADLEARQAFDAAMDIRSLKVPPEARDWHDRALHLETALLRHWLAIY